MSDTVSLSYRYTSQIFELVALQVIVNKQGVSLNDFLIPILTELEGCLFVDCLSKSNFQPIISMLQSKDVSLRSRAEYLGWILRRKIYKDQVDRTIENVVADEGLPAEVQKLIRSYGADRKVSQLAEYEVNEILDIIQQLDDSKYKPFKAMNPFSLDMLKMNASDELDKNYQYSKDANPWLFKCFKELDPELDVESLNKTDTSENTVDQTGESSTPLSWRYIGSEGVLIEPILKDKAAFESDSAVGISNKYTRRYREFLKLTRILVMFHDSDLNIRASLNDNRVESFYKLLDSKLWDNLERLANKCKELDGRGEHKAVTHLKEAYEVCIKGVLDIVEGRSNLINLQSKLTEIGERKEVSKHRGWKQLLLDIISTLLVVPKLLKMIESQLGIKNEHSMFHTRTHSKKVLDGLINSCDHEGIKAVPQT